jgi:hypothetical protein
MSVFDRVRQTFCGLHGHDSLLQFGQDRMYLKCVSCGHESPGWEVTDTPPVAAVSMREEVRRARVVRPQLVSVRRIA